MKIEPPDPFIQPDLDPDDMEWTDANDNNDTGFEHDIPFFFEETGPKHCPPHNAEPIDYFNLFFTVGVLTKFVSETN